MTLEAAGLFIIAVALITVWAFAIYDKNNPKAKHH